jgi:hypothetical protein
MPSESIFWFFPVDVVNDIFRYIDLDTFTSLSLVSKDLFTYFKTNTRLKYSIRTRIDFTKTVPREVISLILQEVKKNSEIDYLNCTLTCRLFATLQPIYERRKCVGVKPEYHYSQTHFKRPFVETPKLRLEYKIKFLQDNRNRHPSQMIVSGKLKAPPPLTLVKEMYSNWNSNSFIPTTAETNPIRWASSIGSALIKNVQISIGNQVIDEYSNEWFNPVLDDTRVSYNTQIKAYVPVLKVYYYNYNFNAMRYAGGMGGLRYAN